MNGWLRTRRVWMLGAVAVLCAGTVIALADEIAPMPVAVGTEGRTLWSTFLPLLWAVAVADVFGSKAQAVEVRPAARLALVDAGLFLLACLAGSSILAWGSGSLQSPVAVVGHVLVLTALTTWVTLHRNPGAGVLASSALLLLTTLYGVNAPLALYVRVLQPDGDALWSLGLGVALCLGTLQALLLGRGSFALKAGPHL